MKDKKQSTILLLNIFKKVAFLYYILLVFSSCSQEKPNDNSGSAKEPDRGHFMYAGPRVMELNKIEEIKVWITTDSIRDMPRFLKNLGENDSTIIEKIRVGKVMEVRLMEQDSTAQNFRITALNTKEQLLDDYDPTTWQWNILPLKVGTHKLIIVAKIKMMMKDLDLIVYKDLPVFERRVTVAVQNNEPPAVVETTKGDDTQDMMIGVLFIAFLGAAIWWFLKKRTKKKRRKLLINSKEYKDFDARLEEMIEMSEIEDALEYCEQFFRKHSLKKLITKTIHLKSNYSNNQSMFHKDLIDNQEFKRNKSKIVGAILEMVEMSRSQ